MRPLTRPRIVLALAATAAVLGLARGPLRACLWDRDTLATEAKGLPEVVRAITGRFERNPPLYYQMRLARVRDRVEAEPDDFEAYDDAGVASDRLGRSDDAIAWMERKRKRLEAAEGRGKDVSEHRYRYLANAGTFHAHRWLRAGTNREDMGDLRAARDFLARAIRLNPKAHFGRERYQLRFLEWVLDTPAYDPEKNHYHLPAFLDFEKDRDDPHEAVIGLTGLVALGNAWESVDVFNTLVKALDADNHRSSVAKLARWRCEELVAAGKTSLMPGAPKGEDLRDALAHTSLMPPGEKGLEQNYRALRAEADAWQKARTDFMNARLKQGSHPDTDPHFWDGYDAPAPPSIDEPVSRKGTFSLSLTPATRGESFRLTMKPAELAIGTAGAAATLLVLFRRPLQRRLARRNPEAREP